MKKTPQIQSLINSRRGSLQKLPIQHRQSTQKKDKQLKQQQNPIPKHRIPSPVVKSIKLLESFRQQPSKQQQKKCDIKQIYEYKIKQRAQRSKISQKTTQKSKLLQSTLQHQQNNNNNNHNNNNIESTSLSISQLEDKRLIESLKLQNEKMSKQLYQLVKQNKQLTQLLKESQQQKRENTKNNNDPKKDHNTKQKSINQKDYKKTILNKLNDRQRIKTQMTSSFTKLNGNHINQHQQQRLTDSKSKCSVSSRQKLPQGSGSNITMNLNMSFVKIKSPSTSKHHEFKSTQKQFISKIPKSNSSKNFHFKEQSSKSTSKLPSHSTSNNSTDIKSLFRTYLSKKSITPKDLSEFYLLNKKIFTQFTTFISFSRHVYAQILNKIDISQCYDSKRLQQSRHSKNQNNMKETLRLIQELYKMNPLHNSTKREFESLQMSEKKYFVSEIQFGDGHQTPESSVVSFKEEHNNVEREKSYEKYRLKKLNQNLNLFVNMQSKKMKTQATQPQTTQSKVYFSKPISTSVSRKISFNNSFNNSLKNSKIE